MTTQARGLTQSAGLDLENVSITVTEYDTGGFQFRLDTEGLMISDVVVFPPIGAPIALTCAGGAFADCNYEELFANLAALQAKFPPGPYVFAFNGGARSTSLTHANFSITAGFADVAIAPVLPGATTTTSPSITWDCAAGCPTVSELGVELANTSGEVFAASYIPPTAGSIALPNGPLLPPPTDLEGAVGALIPGEAYDLWSTVESYTTTAHTLGVSDAFEFEDASKREQHVEFSVAPFVDLGNGLAGVSRIPVLIGGGTLLPGTPGVLRLTSAAPAALSILFVSFSSTPIPFKCGTLVPVPAAAQWSVFTDGAGSITIPWASWPGSLSGISIYFQYAILDPAAVCGVALSNALRADVP